MGHGPEVGYGAVFKGSPSWPRKQHQYYLIMLLRSLGTFQYNVTGHRHIVLFSWAMSEKGRKTLLKMLAP